MKKAAFGPPSFRCAGGFPAPPIRPALLRPFCPVRSYREEGGGFGELCRARVFAPMAPPPQRAQATKGRVKAPHLCEVWCISAAYMRYSPVIRAESIFRRDVCDRVETKNYERRRGLLVSKRFVLLRSRHHGNRRAGHRAHQGDSGRDGGHDRRRPTLFPRAS